MTITAINVIWTATSSGYKEGDYVHYKGRHRRILSIVGTTLTVERTWRCVWYDVLYWCEATWSRLTGAFL